MPLERKLSARRSQRRKKKEEENYGIQRGNSLAIPGQMNDDDDNNPPGSRPPTASPTRNPTVPKTPMVKRRSIDQGKSFDMGTLTHKPGYIPGGNNVMNEKRKSLAPKQKATKMDVARAMGIMGFNSSRWLECSQTSGTDPKTELDKAQFNRMQELLKRKRQAQKEVETGKVKVDNSNLTGYQKRTADKGIEKIQDDIMALHEAYQFLMKKYKLNEKKIQMKSVGYATLLGAQMGGGTGSWGDDGCLGDRLDSSGSLGTRLSEDLGDINLNMDSSDADMQKDVF